MSEETYKRPSSSFDLEVADSSRSPLVHNPQNLLPTRQESIEDAQDCQDGSHKTGGINDSGTWRCEVTTGERKTGNDRNKERMDLSASNVSVLNFGHDFHSILRNCCQQPVKIGVVLECARCRRGEVPSEDDGDEYVSFIPVVSLSDCPTGRAGSSQTEGFPSGNGRECKRSADAMHKVCDNKQMKFESQTKRQDDRNDQHSWNQPASNSGMSCSGVSDCKDLEKANEQRSETIRQRNLVDLPVDNSVEHFRRVSISAWCPQCACGVRTRTQIRLRSWKKICSIVLRTCCTVFCLRLGSLFLTNHLCPKCNSILCIYNE